MESRSSTWSSVSSLWSRRSDSWKSATSSVSTRMNSRRGKIPSTSKDDRVRSFDTATSADTTATNDQVARKEGGHGAETEWVDCVLRSRYNDPQKLMEGLNDIYGQGHYRVKAKSGRWIVSAPRPLDEDEMQELEHAMRRHYRNNTGA